MLENIEINYSPAGVYGCRRYGRLLYGRNYKYKSGPYDCTGTEYFKDRAMTEFYARNPYKAIRKTHVETINGFPTLIVKI